MRPILKFLEDDLIERIIAEAKTILCSLGVELHNKEVLALLSDHGAKVDMDNYHVVFNEDIIENSLGKAQGSFKLYDVEGNETHDFSDYNVYFTPGSTALNILDHSTKQIRKPTTGDYVNYVKRLLRN